MRWGAGWPAPLDHLSSQDFLHGFPGLVAVVSVSDFTLVAMSADLETVLRADSSEDPAVRLSDFVTDEVREALERSARDGATVVVPHVRVVVRSCPRYVDLTIRPMPTMTDPPCLLVRLDDSTDLVTTRGRAFEALADYEIAELRHRELFELTTLGVIYQDLDGVIRDANPAALEILGASTFDELRGRDSADPRWQAVGAEGQPLSDDDHPPRRVLATGEPSSGMVIGVNRVDLPQRRWLRITSNPRFDASGALTGVFSLFEDITEHMRLQRIADEIERERFGTQLRRAMEAMHDTVVIGSPVLVDGVAVDLRIEYFTGQREDAGSTAAMGSEALVGRMFSEAWPELVATDMLDRFLEVLRTGRAVHLEEVDAGERANGATRVADLSVAEVDGQLVVLWRDVTERVERERQLREAERTARLARWHLCADHELEVSTATPRVVGAPDRSAAVSVLHPLVKELVTRDPGAEQSIEFRVRAPGGGSRDLVVSGGPRGSAWSGTVQDVTSVRRVERELASERETVDLLQRAVLPEVLEPIDGFHVEARYENAAGGDLVGGDWFDVVTLADSRRFAVIVGDVTGHGVAAAQTMLQLRHWTRLLCVDSDTPSRLLRRLNTAVHQFLPGEMATVLVVFVQPETDELLWATAGHPPIVAVRNSSAELLPHDAVGCPIGVGGRWEGRDAHAALGGVEALVAYTDGLIERRGESLVEGFERLVAVLGSEIDRSQQWCDQLMRKLRFDDGARDDACVVVLRPTGRN